MNKIVGLDIGRQGMKGVFVFPAFIKVFCTCTLLLFLMSDLAVAGFCLFLSGHMFLVEPPERDGEPVSVRLEAQ